MLVEGQERAYQRAPVRDGDRIDQLMYMSIFELLAMAMVPAAAAAARFALAARCAVRGATARCCPRARALLLLNWARLAAGVRQRPRVGRARAARLYCFSHAAVRQLTAVVSHSTRRDGDRDCRKLACCKILASKPNVLPACQGVQSGVLNGGTARRTASGGPLERLCSA